MLTIHIENGRKVEQLDITGALLHETVPTDEKIWIRFPTMAGLSAASGRVAQLEKCIYGLLQAPKLWYTYLECTLISIGFSHYTCSAS